MKNPPSPIEEAVIKYAAEIHQSGRHLSTVLEANPQAELGRIREIGGFTLDSGAKVRAFRRLTAAALGEIIDAPSQRHMTTS